MFTAQKISPVTGDWKNPFGWALFCHVMVVALALILPQYIAKKPIFPEFLSVDLVTLSAPPPPSAPQDPRPAPSPKASAPPTPLAIPLAPPAPKEVTAPPPKAISIKPLRRKLKRKLPLEPAPETAKRTRDRQRYAQQERDRIQRQLVQEARRQKDLAAAEEAAANDAVRALRQMLQADAATSTALRQQAPAPPSGNPSQNLIQRQYNFSIGGRLMEHWSLPEFKPWAPDLSAWVIIDISQNGRIISHRFEKRSGDRVFDQFVSRTIQEASPLPPIPAAMKMTNYSIGLRFRPGQIQ